MPDKLNAEQIAALKAFDEAMGGTLEKGKKGDNEEPKKEGKKKRGLKDLFS